MNIIVQAELVCPPSWTASFRDFTLIVKTEMEHIVLIETPDPDPFYYWLNPRGAMDFVDDFVPPGKVFGVHLCTRNERMRFPSVMQGEPFRYRTIETDRIIPENCWELIRRVKFLTC